MPLLPWLFLALQSAPAAIELDRPVRFGELDGGSLDRDGRADGTLTAGDLVLGEGAAILVDGPVATIVAGTLTLERGSAIRPFVPEGAERAGVVLVLHARADVRLAKDALVDVGPGALRICTEGSLVLGDGASLRADGREHESGGEIRVRARGMHLAWGSHVSASGADGGKIELVCCAQDPGDSRLEGPVEAVGRTGTGGAIRIALPRGAHAPPGSVDGARAAGSVLHELGALEIPGPVQDVGDLRRAVRDLVRGEANHLAPFVPSVRADRPTAETARGRRNRHVPLVLVDPPWPSVGGITIEVPEFVWGRVEGDPRNREPFFYGRETPAAEPSVAMRFPPERRPVWRVRPGGALVLDSALAGGYVQHLHVLPGDRMLEVRIGATNGTERALDTYAVQICLNTASGGSLRTPRLGSAHFLLDGALVSWDGAGQSLQRIEALREPDTGQFPILVHMLAAVRGTPVPTAENRNFYLARAVDLPAIAFEDREHPGRHLIAFSPYATTVVMNLRLPCIHADPRIATIGPGDERWCSLFYLFFEGDLEAFLRKLAGVYGVFASKTGASADACSCVW